MQHFLWKIGLGFRISDVFEACYPAKAQSEGQIIGLVQLPFFSVLRKLRPLFDGTGEDIVPDKRIAFLNDAKIGMRVYVGDQERGGQAILIHHILPEIQRLIVRFENAPGNRALFV